MNDDKKLANLHGQHKFRARMNNAGLREKMVWINEKVKFRKMDLTEFVKICEKLTLEMDKDEVSVFLNLFIQIIAGSIEKEVQKKKLKTKGRG